MTGLELVYLPRGPYEAPSGTFLDRGRNLPGFPKKGSSMDQGTTERAGEALERPPFKRPRQ